MLHGIWTPGQWRISLSRQELEYMRSTYVPGGPKPLRIVSM